ncbi:hypothetical protein V8F33_008417 [Rhypophila sp. PSN 637]
MELLLLNLLYSRLCFGLVRGLGTCLNSSHHQRCCSSFSTANSWQGNKPGWLTAYVEQCNPPFMHGGHTSLEPHIFHLTTHLHYCPVSTIRLCYSAVDLTWIFNGHCQYHREKRIPWPRLDGTITSRSVYCSLIAQSSSVPLWRDLIPWLLCFNPSRQHRFLAALPPPLRRPQLTWLFKWTTRVVY